jgi:lipopolysaccharide export system protein LptA
MLWGRNAARKIALLWCGVGVVMLWSVVGAEESETAAAGKQEKRNSGSSFADSFSLTSRHEPIHIKSRDLEFRYEEKRIVYHGDVEAVQGDAILKSDLLTVIYEDAPPEADAASAKTKDTAGSPASAELPVKEVAVASPIAEGETAKPEKTKKREKTGPAPAAGGQTTTKQRIKEIIAEGNVDITSGDRHATSRKAVFNEIQRTVVLTGDAHIRELGNWVSGERVTVYLDENRSVVEGGGGDRRAEMEILNQQGGDKTEAGKKGVKRQ